MRRRRTQLPVFFLLGVQACGGSGNGHEATPKPNSDTSFVAVTIYSSTDLAHWKLDGNALDRASVSAKATLDSSTWIGRVGAAYNTSTKKCVLIGPSSIRPATDRRTTEVR